MTKGLTDCKLRGEWMIDEAGEGKGVRLNGDGVEDCREDGNGDGGEEGGGGKNET